MKAIIVDKEGKYAIVLTENGEFIKLRDKGNYQIGHEIDIASGTSDKNMFIKISTVAASVLVILGICFGAYSYAMPYSYINIEINPSIEITMNIYDKVIKTRALNDDGERVLSSVSTGIKGVEDVIGSILESAEQKGYLGKESKNAVMFTVSAKSERKVEAIGEKIENTAGEHIDTSDTKTDIIVETIPLEKHVTAEEMGISPGKVVLLERLQESAPGVDIESYKDVPVEEILKEISENKAVDNEKTEKYENPDKGNNARSNNGKSSKNDMKKDSKSIYSGRLKKNKGSAESSESNAAESKGKNIKNGKGISLGEDGRQNYRELDRNTKNDISNNSKNKSIKDNVGSEDTGKSKEDDSSKDTGNSNNIKSNGDNNNKKDSVGKGNSSEDKRSNKSNNKNKNSDSKKNNNNDENDKNNKGNKDNKKNSSDRDNGQQRRKR